MHKKRLIITSVVSILLVSILMMGSTYSIFTTNDVDEEVNVYATGNLDITYTISSDNVTLTNVEPTSEEEENTIIPYRITVTNNGTVPYMFDLSLEDTTASNQIDSQYIMIKVGYLDSKSLSECTNNIIKEDIILPAGESVDIDVRVWISDTITNTELGKSFFAKLTVDGIAIYDKHEEIDNSILSLRYMKTLFTSRTDYSYFRSDDYREKIKNVSFVDYIDTTNPVESWDVSEKGDHSIVAWVTDNETEGYYDLYIGSNQFIYSKDLSDFFSDMFAIGNISFNNLDTSLTKNMSGMFYNTGYSSTVLTLELGKNFDTSNVTNMESMFYYTGFESTVFTFDLGKRFDTSNVTNMRQMFSYIGCSDPAFSLDLGDNFDTSKVTNMEDMFAIAAYNSTAFTLDLGDKFDTSNVTNMRQMFSNLGHSSTVFTLDLGDKFDTSKVTDMYDMFASVGYSSTVFTLDLGEKFDTSNVINMHGMFYQIGYNSTVFTLDLGDKFNTSNVTDMQAMFFGAGYSNVSFTLNLGPNFYTPKVLNMITMFRQTGNANLNLELDLSTFTFTQVTDFAGMFDFFQITQKIYVKDSTDQSWILDKGFANLSTSNVFIKS